VKPAQGAGKRDAAMTSHKPIIYVVDDDVSVCRALKLFFAGSWFPGVETFNEQQIFLAFQHPRIPRAWFGSAAAACERTGPATMMTAQRLTIPIIFYFWTRRYFPRVSGDEGWAVDFRLKPSPPKKSCLGLLRAVKKTSFRIKNKPRSPRFGGISRPFLPAS